MQKGRKVVIALIIMIVLFAVVGLLFLKNKSDVPSNSSENTEAEGVSTVDIFSAQPGDKVTFGRYEQDADFENGPEELDWIVLATEQSRKLLMTEDCIEAMPYHAEAGKITWKDSYVNAWLNMTFVETSFDEEEKKAICMTRLNESVNEDYRTKAEAMECKAFLLSVEEIEEYVEEYDKDEINEDLKANMSYYMVSRDAEKCLGYWLRTPAVDYDGAVYVSQQGVLHLEGDGCVKYNLVRPALWIDTENIRSIKTNE